MSRPIRLEVNGREVERTVEPRLLLSDFVRHELGLTGTHVGCEHGVCGACTVLLDGVAVRSCLLLAVQADGRVLRTVEDLYQGGQLHPVQAAFHQTQALQCGYCTPGFLMAITAFLEERPGVEPTEEEILEVVGGNLCRCTGYLPIVEAVRLASRALREGRPRP